MLGYSQATIERKATARNMKPFEYELYLVGKRQTRNDRRRKARAERRAAENA